MPNSLKTPPSEEEMLYARQAQRLSDLELEVEAMKAAQIPVLREAIISGIREGMKRMVEDPQAMDDGVNRLLEAIGRRSTKAAGMFTMSMLSNLPKSVMKFLLAGALVYQIGGWEFLVSLIKHFFSSSKS